MMAENQTTCTRATGIEQSTAFAYISVLAALVLSAMKSSHTEGG